MLTWMTLAVGLAVACLLYMLRGRRSSPDKPAPTRSAAAGSTSVRELRPSSYPGAGIRPQANACDAAWQLKGKRYLLSQVPTLPLPGCDRTTCLCEYIEYPDRRSGRDRRASYISATGLECDLSHDKRKAGKDRRKQSPPSGPPTGESP